VTFVIYAGGRRIFHFPAFCSIVVSRQVCAALLLHLLLHLGEHLLHPPQLRVLLGQHLVLVLGAGGLDGGRHSAARGRRGR